MDKPSSIFAGRVKCPYCSYEMPVWYEPTAEAQGVWIKCKGKHCKKLFEIKVEETK